MSEAIKLAYNQWASSYDSNQNRTRDLEAIALRELLQKMTFKQALELGCGTGKNSVWLSERVEKLIAVDFSDDMLALARAKVKAKNCVFVQANLMEDWNFASGLKFDLLSFSLVLEHLEDLNLLFQKASKVVAAGGIIYVGELHPFKQYAGTKARFDSEEGVKELTCFTHSISEFIDAADAAGFSFLRLKEYFDADSPGSLPRILGLVFQKNADA